jgi:hypothetical protein
MRVGRVVAASKSTGLLWSRSRAELSGSEYSFRYENKTSSAVRTAAHQAIQKVDSRRRRSKKKRGEDEW